MSSIVFSDVEDNRSSADQNPYPDSEQFGPRLHTVSDSSGSPIPGSPTPGSVRTDGTSVSLEDRPIRRRLRDDWDLQVNLKHTHSNGATHIDAGLKCSSGILCDSSRKLKAMIEVEGRTRRIRSGSRRSLDIIIPRQYTASAVDALICSMHHFNRYRWMESFEDLMHLSIACWELECSTGPIERLGDTSRADLWRTPEEGRGGQDYVGWVFVALVFGWDDIFRAASQELVMGGEAAIESGGDYLPVDLRWAIKKKRATTIAGIISFVRQTSQSYLLSGGMSPGVIYTFLRTLDERLQHFGVHLIETAGDDAGDVPSARELISRLKDLPRGYRGEVPDPPVSPARPPPPALLPPPLSPSRRSHRPAELPSGGGGAPGSLAQQVPIENWRAARTSGALFNYLSNIWHKIRPVFEQANCQPPNIDVTNGLPAPQQESAEAQEWGRVRAEFLAKLEYEVEGFGTMELEEFRELREKNILRPERGGNRNLNW